MKAGRLILFFIVAVLATVALLSFLQPTQQSVTRRVSINAPASTIYPQLARLENFNRFSVWTQQDSSAVYKLTGNDGTVGATSSWKGSPEISGEGKIEIVGLKANQQVSHRIQISEPKKLDATSVFDLRETNPAVTEVSWTFTLATPRPWNIFNLFYSLDKEKGSEFEQGLQALKSLIEKPDLSKDK